MVKSSVSAPDVVTTTSHSSEIPSLQTKKVTEKSIEIESEERETTSKSGTRRLG